LTSHFFGEITARITVALFSLSPLALLLGGSFMSHTTFLALFMAGGWQMVRALRGDSGRGYIAGFALGWAAMTRPQDFAILSLVVLLGIALASQAWSRIPRVALQMLVGSAPVLVFLAWWNTRLYGHPWVIGYGFTQSDFLFAPFQGDYGLSPDFTASEAFRLFLATVARFDFIMLGWPSSLAFAAVPFLRLRWDRRDIVCLAGCAAVAAMYFFYDYLGIEFEARYYHTLLPFALVLTARGLQIAARSCETGASLIVVLAVLFFLHGAWCGWRGYILPTYAHAYEQATPAIDRLAREAGLRNALVLIDDSGSHDFLFSSGFQFNDPFLRGPVVYAKHLGKDHECLRLQFAGRDVYRFEPLPDFSGGRLVKVDD
jgi:hypothetical protein